MSKNQTNNGCFSGLLSLFMLIIAIVFYLNDNSVAFVLSIVVAIISLFYCFAHMQPSELNNKENEDEPDIFTFTVKNLEEEPSKPVVNPVMLKIREKHYEEIKKSMLGIRVLCGKLSRQKDLFDMINNLSTSVGGDPMPDIGYLKLVLKSLFLQDLKRCYEEMDLPFTLDLNQSTSQCLFVVVDALDETNQGIGNYEKYRQTLSKDTQTIKYVCDNFKILCMSGVDFSVEGGDDFGFSAMLGNYGDEESRERYRQHFSRLVTTIAQVDGPLTRQRQACVDHVLNVTGQRSEDVEREVVVKGNPEEELERLIGLHSVKREVKTLSNFIALQQKRAKMGLPSPPISYHCVFTGNPGTGKTTVARILACIFKEMGILSKGQLIETDRSGLVAEYVGQTAVKTNRIIDKAIDGVLFIDEAYSLVAKGEDFGQEAIATLLKRMEDDRDRLVVILAGYSKEMEEFIDSNPGLRSRFNRYIHFPDYSVSELYEIFLSFAQSNMFSLTDEAKSQLRLLLAKVVNEKPKDFGNARYVRNLFEKTMERQANRLSSIHEPTKEELTEIIADDIDGTDVS